jgi:hypothetical protein
MSCFTLSLSRGSGCSHIKGSWKNKENFVFMSDTDQFLAHGVFFKENDKNDKLLNGPTFLSFQRKSSQIVVL